MVDAGHQRYKETLDRILAIDKLPTNQEVIDLIAFSENNTSTKNPRLNDELFGAMSIDTWLISNHIYHVDTVEFVNALAKTIRAQGITGKHVEIAAGRGKLSYWLRQKGVPIISTDERTYPRLSSEHVEELEGTEALKKYNPELVLTCWLSRRDDGLQKKMLEYETVRTYVDIGSFGETDDSGWRTFPHIRFQKKSEIRGRREVPEYKVTFSKSVSEYTLHASTHGIFRSPSRRGYVSIWQRIK